MMDDEVQFVGILKQIIRGCIEGIIGQIGLVFDQVPFFSLEHL